MQDPLSRLLPEERLLISLCRLQFSEEQKKDIEILMRMVSDWDKVVNLSNEHGIIALFCRNLIDLGLDKLIPERPMSIFNMAYLASLARNTRIYELLGEILGIAGKEGIDVILIKGLALEKTVYGDKGLRQMNDLDILVKPDPAFRLRKALLKNGFESPPMISPLHEKIFISYGKHLPEMHKNRLSAEIHIKLFDQKGDSLTKEFIQRSVISGKNGNFYLPDTQMHFLYLVRHLDRHESEGISQLRLYADLALLIQRNKEILNLCSGDFAERAGLGKALKEKLFLLGNFWGIEITSGQYSPVDNIEKEKMCDRFIAFLRSPRETGTKENIDSLLKPMKELEGLFNKILFAAGYIFPSLSFMKYRYGIKNNATAFLFYPVRWIKIFAYLFTGRL